MEKIPELTEEKNPRLVTRRKFLYGSIIGVSATAIAGCVSGIITRKHIEVTYRTIELRFNRHFLFLRIQL